MDRRNQNWTTLYQDEITANTNLTQIDVSDNNITEFDSTIFSNHTSLQVLILSRNKEYDFPPDVIFLSSDSLERFECSACGITNIYKETFFKLLKLRELNLSYNNLTVIHSGVYIPLLLRNLNFDFNKLETLPNDLLKKTAVNSLSMNHNPDFNFQKNEVFLRSKLLLIFQCNYCGITSIYNETFSELPNIEGIFLNDNNISVINFKMFEKTPNITSLSFERNRVSEFAMNIFDVIVNLKSLCIDGNPLLTSSVKAMKKYYVQVKLRNNCTELDSKNYFENDPHLIDETVEANLNKGISDAFIASYLLIILAAQVAVVGLLTMYWFKIVLTDKIDEFDYSNSVLNDYDVYNVS